MPDGTVIDLVYDGDGNRVSKTVSGATTYYLVDTNNLTGYAQVIDELTDNFGSFTVSQRYSYGLDLVSQTAGLDNDYYLYDGLGSVVGRSNATGVMTDTYTYDAFGIGLSQSGTSENAYRFTGEQFDADLGLYYLRARYLHPGSGRFWTLDTYEGRNGEPLTLHKYLYAHGNPVNSVDPSGNNTMTLPSVLAGITVGQIIAATAVVSLGYAFSSSPELRLQLIYATGDAVRLLRVNLSSPPLKNPSIP